MNQGASMACMAVLAAVCLASPAVSETAEDSRLRQETVMGETAVQELIEAIDGALAEWDAIEFEPDPDAEPFRLDMPAAVNLALERNPLVQQADAELDAAEARSGVARSAMLPEVSVGSAYTYLDYDAPELIGGRFPALGVLNRLFQADRLMPDKDTRTDQAQLRQVLYAGGSIRAGLDAARSLADAQALEREASIQQLVYNVQEAYYDALLTDALLRVARESVRTFERNLRDAREMFDAGMVSRFEVLRAETELSARKTDATAAENGRRLAMANLRRLLNLPHDTPLVLDGHFDGEPIRDSINEALAEALATRPELKALRKGIEAAEAGERAARGEFLPRVAAAVEYTNIEGAAALTPDGWSFNVGAEWTLFGGGRRWYQLREARADTRAARHQLDELERLIELDVNNAYIQTREAMAKVRSERDTVELAREGLRMAELRFQEGAGTQSEVLEAELALTSAETQLAEALRDFAVASAAMDRALGRSWTDGDAEPAATAPQGDD